MAGANGREAQHGSGLTTKPSENGGTNRHCCSWEGGFASTAGTANVTLHPVTSSNLASKVSRDYPGIADRIAPFMRSSAPRGGSSSPGAASATAAQSGDSPVARASSRPAAAIALSYMMVTLPLALRVLSVGAPSDVHASRWRASLMVGAHVLAIAPLAWAAWRSRAREERTSGLRSLTNAFADWLPLIIVSFLYAELPWLMAAYRGGQAVVYHDAWVQAAEWEIFRTQPSHTLAGALPFRWLSEGVHLGYVSYYGIIYVPPLVLYLRRRREAFAVSAGALMLAFTSCFLVFAFFPVEGPRYAWAPPPGIPEGFLRRATLWVLREGSSRGAAFPSSHAAVSVAQTVSLWLAGERRIAVVVGTFTVLLVVGAVYGGFHYAVDMAVGVVVGIACGVTGVVLGRRAK